jgi:hypothetical protein
VFQWIANHIVRYGPIFTIVYIGWQYSQSQTLHITPAYDWLTTAAELTLATAFNSLICILHWPQEKHRLYCWWRHRLRGSVFIEPSLRNGLHNSVVPPLLGADDIESTASSIVACWIVFTELLPGNALIKSVRVLLYYRQHNKFVINKTILLHKHSYIKYICCMFRSISGNFREVYYPFLNCISNVDSY